MSFIEDLTGRVTPQINEKLIQSFIMEEVYQALKQMYPTKAFGIDNMLSIFFQIYWNIVGQSISTVVLHALNSSEFLRNINHTFITLILKKKYLTKIVDFHSINLCNVIYNLVSKMISNRLKTVLFNLVLESQCVFVTGRQFTDNELIIYELVHFLRRKKNKNMFYVYQARYEQNLWPR